MFDPDFVWDFLARAGEFWGNESGVADLRTGATKRLARLALLSLCVSPATANEIPANLRGHTILLSWSEQRQFESADGIGVSHDDVVSGKAAIYLGAQGRIISGIDRTVSPNVAAAKTFSEKDVSEDSKNWTWRFEGRTLSGYSVQEGGVQRISVDFGSNLLSCTMRMSYATQQGALHFVMKGWWRGEKYNLTAHSLTARECSIQPGNAMASPQ
jgi:hypothetical protein